jgi:hypothetical protein
MGKDMHASYIVNGMAGGFLQFKFTYSKGRCGREAFFIHPFVLLSIQSS